MTASFKWLTLKLQLMPHMYIFGSSSNGFYLGRKAVNDEQHNVYANNLRHLRTAMAEPKYVNSSASWQELNNLYAQQGTGCSLVSSTQCNANFTQTKEDENAEVTNSYPDILLPAPI